MISYKIFQIHAILKYSSRELEISFVCHAGKQTGSHKSILPLKKRAENLEVYLYTLLHVFVIVHFHNTLQV